MILEELTPVLHLYKDQPHFFGNPVVMMTVPIILLQTYMKTMQKNLEPKVMIGTRLEWQELDVGSHYRELLKIAVLVLSRDNF